MLDWNTQFYKTSRINTQRILILWKFILWSNWISFPLPLDWLPLYISFQSSLSTVKMALNWIRIILQKISSISIRCAPFNLAVICLVYMLMSLMHFEFSLTPHIEPILKKKYLSFQIWTNCELLLLNGNLIASTSFDCSTLTLRFL